MANACIILLLFGALMRDQVIVWRLPLVVKCLMGNGHRRKCTPPFHVETRLQQTASGGVPYHEIADKAATTPEELSCTPSSFSWPMVAEIGCHNHLSSTMPWPLMCMNPFDT